MSLRTPLLTTLAVVSMLLFSHPASAVSVTGNVGLGYANNTAGRLTLDQDLTNAFLQDYGLGISGSPLAPGFLDIQGNLRYSNAARYQPENSFSMGNLTYNLRLNIAQKTVVPVALNATRTTSTTSSDILGSSFIGNTTTTNLSANAAARAPDMPNISVGVATTDTASVSDFREEATRETLLTTLSMGQNTHLAHYMLRGRASRSRSSLSGASFNSYTLSLAEHSDLNEQMRFSGRGAIFRRIATLDEAGNPDGLSSSAGLNLFTKHSTLVSSSFRYGYAHSAYQLSGQEDRDATAHSGNALATYQIHPQLKLGGGAIIEQQNSSVGDQGLSSNSQSLQSRVQSEVESDTLLASGTFGLNLGVSTPAEASTAFLYGVSAGLGLSAKELERSQLTGRLQGHWSEDLSEAAQHRAGATVSLQARTTALRRTAATIVASLDYRRQRNALVNDVSTFSAETRLGGQWRRYLFLNIGGRYQRGVTEFFEDPVNPDLILVASESRMRTLSFMAGTSLFYSLTLRLVAGMESIELEERSQSRDFAELRVEYRLGRFALSAWNRMTRSRLNSDSQVNNTFYTMLSRSFSAGF